MLDKIKELGYKYSTIGALTINVFDFVQISCVKLYSVMSEDYIYVSAKRHDAKLLYLKSDKQLY